MKRLLLSCMIAFLLSAIESSSLRAYEVNVVPCPAKSNVLEGSFTLQDGAVVSFEDETQQEIVKNFLSEYAAFSGLKLTMACKADGAAIRLVTDSAFPKEGYSLVVSNEGITIKASDRNGFFYALQTLRLSHSSLHPDKVPFMEIVDKPRFSYRGMMLDVARYFMQKQDVMRIIDCMSVLKMNKLHFHLTDDNGWRLEIKKYPRLTEVGAWRVNRRLQPFLV